jgi:hypothetical protein
MNSQLIAGIFSGLKNRIVSEFLNLSFRKAAKLLLLLFVFFFPFQIRSLIYGGPAYLSGNFNEFTTFFVYFADILLLAAFLCWAIAVYRQEIAEINYGFPEITIMLLFLLLIALASVMISENRMMSFFMAFRLLEMFVLYFLIVNEVAKKDDLIKVFILTMVLQAGIAVFQYLRQGSIGLRMLGEPVISPETLGVAKIDINGSKLLRPYGTFSHANVLAGGLFMALIFILSKINRKFIVYGLAGVLISAAIVLSFSRSAIMALIGALLVFISISEKKVSLKYVLLGVSILVFILVLFNVEGVFILRFLFGDGGEAVNERLEYLDISRRMLIAHPLGIGLGNFTIQMQDFTLTKLAPWVYQPVHNVYMLMANELGVIGGALFVLIFGLSFYWLLYSLQKVKKQLQEARFAYALIAILAGFIVIALFDHYFITIYQGQVMLFAYLGLASSFIKKSLLPFKKS